MKRVHIIGFASASRLLAPVQDGDEVWSLNHAYTFLPWKWTRYFEVHPYEHFTKDLMRDGQPQDGKRHLEWMQAEPEGARPIYMQQHYENIPASTRFPREEINAWFAERGGKQLGCYAEDYYTSTIAEMLALAIYEGFDEIGLYGVDMLQAEEYYYQRSGCEYYIGFARGMGITCIVPQQSALCKASYVYGYSEPATDVGKIAPYVEYIKSKAEQSIKDKEKAVSAIATIDGGVQMIEILKKFLTDNPQATVEDILKSNESNRENLIKRRLEMSHTVAAMDGQYAGFECSKSWAEHWARGGALIQ